MSSEQKNAYPWKEAAKCLKHSTEQDRTSLVNTHDSTVIVQHTGGQTRPTPISF